MRKVTVGEGIITNMQLINAIEKSQGVDFSRNEDGFVVVADNKEKIEGIHSIQFDGSEYGVMSLEGIEYFSNLSSLYIKNSQIQEADMSANKELVYLNIYSADF